jgi:hypothetical protein
MSSTPIAEFVDLVTEIRSVALHGCARRRTAPRLWAWATDRLAE